MATESGFVRDTFEKVLRLKEILKFLNEDKSLREHLLLKGGKNSDEAYYRFEIKEWKELNIPLVAKEVRDFPFFTNMFLLQHCPDVPDLHISSEEEYRLYIEVRRLANDASVNETDAEPGFKYDDKTIIMENGDIVVLKDGTKIEQISIETFMRKPRESMRVIAK